MVVTLTAERLAGPAGASVAASAGRSVAAPDLVHGPTTVALLDLPTLGDGPVNTPTLAIAAAGISAGWRRATVLGSLDGGASWTTIGRTAPAAVIGHALDALPAAGAMTIDLASGVEVELLNDAMALSGSDAAGVVSASANLALIGDELIQFGQAEQTGPTRFRLSRLVRGRRGTEWAVATHAAGDRFVLIEPESLLAWPLPAGALGSHVLVAATGIGDSLPVQAGIDVIGRACRPPAPVACSGVMMPDRALQCRWTRRSRTGWSWLDGADAPLGEEAERYRLTVSRTGGTSASIEVVSPEALLAPATIAGLGGAGPLAVTVAQIGTIAPSMPPATFVVPMGA